jgi:hypothetical protein
MKSSSKRESAKHLLWFNPHPTMRSVYTLHTSETRAIHTFTLVLRGSQLLLEPRANEDHACACVEKHATLRGFHLKVNTVFAFLVLFLCVSIKCCYFFLLLLLSSTFQETTHKSRSGGRKKMLQHLIETTVRNTNFVGSKNAKNYLG